MRSTLSRWAVSMLTVGIIATPSVAWASGTDGGTSNLIAETGG